MFESGNWNDEVKEIMLENGLLVTDSSADEKYRGRIKSEFVDIKMVPILYLVLTKNCNLSCRQCFQYERHRQKLAPLPMMTIETAVAGIDSFVRHLKHSDGSQQYKTQIFLYGGEPFLNWNVFRGAVEYIESLRGSTLPEDVEVMTVTNGTCIRESHARFMVAHDIRVALSVDGPKEVNDKFRVTTKGRGTFDCIERGLRLLQKFGVKTTLSVTITPSIASRLVEIVRWAHDDMRVEAISFNMIGGSSFDRVASMTRAQYDEDVTTSIIKAFKEARELGLYEDRIARKAEGFISHKFNAVDCAAVGNQIVVQPDGRIAYCHASEEYNGGSVFDVNFFVFDDPGVAIWKQSLPINNELGCQDCSAIATCGYGCFHHVQELGGSPLEKRDEQYCLHNRRTFEFLVWDLFEKTQAS
ncbi:MAG: radical SAM protein [Candidatus Parcubacteria bacterium]|nr:radical SAM protein [Candidatus Parcubacteria bacterium]